MFERLHCSRLFALLIPLLWLTGCAGKREHAVFKILSPEQTGVTFANTITTDDSLNIQTDVYVYNGGGVGIGDIDNDGLPDIFFAGNMVSSRLYLNKGNMRFEDITKQAGVSTNRWASGVTMVDINNDGYLDIYVSVSGPEWSKPEERANLLFINNGDRTFMQTIPGAFADKPPVVTTSSIGITVTGRSRMCPKKLEYCTTPVTASVPSSLT